MYSFITWHAFFWVSPGCGSMVQIRALKLQSKMNCDDTHSSEIWAFFRRGSNCRKGLGDVVLCIPELCGWCYGKAHHQCFWHMFLMLERLTGVCSRTALEESAFPDAFCMISHNFPVRAVLKEELSDSWTHLQCLEALLGLIWAAESSAIPTVCSLALTVDSV